MEIIKLKFDTICQLIWDKNKGLNPWRIETKNEFDPNTETDQDKILLVDRECRTWNRSAINI